MTTKRTIRTLALLVGLLAATLFAIGAGNSSLNFSHPLHVEDGGMACEDCHADIMESQRGDMLEMPGHDVCEMCHDIEDEDSCTTCHNGEPMAMPTRYAGDRYTAFAHGFHGEIECVNCHGTTDLNSPLMPVDATCQACHEEHEVMPRTHSMATWHSDHGFDATMSEADCAACHTQNTCDECHQGENILANTPHPPEWQFTHSLETMYGQECMTCHETRDECISCHRAVVPTPHELGATYANSVNGGGHVDDAKGFILACLACHDIENEDPTCARCHE
jgi:hypothetical protein